MPTTDTTRLNTPTTTEELTAAYEAFLSAFPAYASTGRLDTLRATEYARLDQQRQVYLDYTGGGVYAEAQVREHVAMLTDGVFGNPHSKNLTSMAMTERVEQTREYVLRYFNASPDEYMVIFTPNATGALKLIGESYPFGPGDNYLLTFDNHNSVNGIREFARAKGATRHLHSGRCPRFARRSGRARQRPGIPFAPRRAQPLRLSCAVELLRCAAPAGVDRGGASPGLGCAAGRGGVRSHQPAGPQSVAPRLRRISPSTRSSATRQARLPARAQIRASRSCIAPGTRVARSPFPRSWRLTTISHPGSARLRGWHGELSEHPSRGGSASNDRVNWY